MPGAGYGLTFGKSSASSRNESRNYEIRNSNIKYIQENKYFMILSTVLREYFMFGAFPKIENMDRK